ncbi:hypothetical protein GCM10020331_079940 [Ectobacillus funiculus]
MSGIAVGGMTSKARVPTIVKDRDTLIKFFFSLISYLEQARMEG